MGGVEQTAVRRSARAVFVRQVVLWHWVSSGVCLGGMLLFTVTGITLNHAGSVASTPVVTKVDVTAPPPVRAALQTVQASGRERVPLALAEWLGREFGSAGDGVGEWSAEEVYVSLPRPGGDAWVTVERATGRAHYEKTDRGWIAYWNDLHKGRHTGRAWSVYIDVLAAACLIFTLTGLLLLQTHAAKRPATWPVVGLSVAAPVLVLLFFTHR